MKHMQKITSNAFGDKIAKIKPPRKQRSGAASATASPGVTPSPAKTTKQTNTLRRFVNKIKEFDLMTIDALATNNSDTFKNLLWILPDTPLTEGEFNTNLKIFLKKVRVTVKNILFLTLLFGLAFFKTNTERETKFLGNTSKTFYNISRKDATVLDKTDFRATKVKPFIETALGSVTYVDFVSINLKSRIDDLLENYGADKGKFVARLLALWDSDF